MCIPRIYTYTVYDMFLNICQRLNVTTCINILRNTAHSCLTFLNHVTLIDVGSYFSVV